MNNYNTVLFKDDEHNFYLGSIIIKNDIYSIKEFQQIQGEDIQNIYGDIGFNEFLFVKIQKNNGEIKITPIKQCKLTNVENSEPLNFYKLEKDELLKLFNDGIPQSIFKLGLS